MEEDNLLINKYLKGDQESFKMLIDKYTSSIYNFTQRFTGPLYAPDITQEIFIKVWKNLKNFDKNKAQFKTWLFTIARNSVTDYLRKKKSIPFSSLSDDNFIEDNIEDEAKLPDEILDNLQDKEMLDKVLDELSPEYRLILTLYYQEDMTFKEIGEVLDKPLNTVKSYHLRAIKKLKDLCTKI
jgi:RNA polymerase sigma-70 factor (ECF subfamily)